MKPGTVAEAGSDIFVPCDAMPIAIPFAKRPDMGGKNENFWCLLYFELSFSVVFALAFMVSTVTERGSFSFSPMLSSPLGADSGIVSGCSRFDDLQAACACGDVT